MQKIGAALTVLGWAGVACGQPCEPSWSEEFAVGPDDTVFAAFAGGEALYVGGALRGCRRPAGRAHRLV